MYAHYALFVPAAFFVVYFAIFAGGAFIGTVSLAAQFLRAVLGTRSTTARVATPQLPVRPMHLRPGNAIQSFRAPAAAC